MCPAYLKLPLSVASTSSGLDATGPSEQNKIWNTIPSLVTTLKELTLIRMKTSVFFIFSSFSTLLFANILVSDLPFTQVKLSANQKTT